MVGTRGFAAKACQAGLPGTFTANSMQQRMGLLMVSPARIGRSGSPEGQGDIGCAGHRKDGLRQDSHVCAPADGSHHGPARA